MKNCNEHPGYIPLPENTKNRSHYARNYQLTPEIIEKNPDLQVIYDEKMASLKFSDFFNECFMDLTPEDQQYLPVLKEASEILFNKLRRYAHPFNCGQCVETAVAYTENNELLNSFGEFKLVFVRKGPLIENPFGNEPLHYWIELVKHNDLSQEELVKNFFKLKRLIIDFTGLHSGERNISKVEHNKYLPFFGSSSKANEYSKQMYQKESGVIIVDQLSKIGFATFYFPGVPPQTLPRLKGDLES